MNDGGPAFPTPDIGFFDGRANLPASQGMTLRDYFIAHAPAAEISDFIPSDPPGCAAFIGIEPAEYRGHKWPEHYCRVLAKARGLWADAMLADRDRARRAESATVAEPMTTVQTRG